MGEKGIEKTLNMDKIDQVVGKVFTALTWLSIIAVLIIMAITVVNVITRAFFRYPIFGVVDISEVFLSIVALCALPIVTMFNEHIKVDLVADRLPQRLQDALTCFNLSACAIMLVIISIFTFLKAGRILELGTSSGALHISFYPIYYLISAMMMVSAICAFYNLLHFLATGDLILQNTFSEIKIRFLKAKEVKEVDVQ